MDYQAAFRPSCRSIIRQLNSLITSGNDVQHYSVDSEYGQYKTTYQKICKIHFSLFQFNKKSEFVNWTRSNFSDQFRSFEVVEHL